MDPAEACKAAWLKANTDTERFAALFVVIKLLKSSEVTDIQRREIFETIGFTFLKRLLESDAPDGCPPNILKAVSLSILSCFCTDQELVVDSRMSDFIGPVKSVLDENHSSAEDEPLVIDALSCFLGMVNVEKHRQRMVENGVFPSLVKQYCTGTYGSSQALHVLVTLVLHTDIQLSEENKESLSDMLKKMSADFQTETSEKKFELCEHILLILLKYQAFQLSDASAVTIREALTDLLRNKLGKEQRDTAIKLASILVDKFWSQWFIEDAENSKTFFIVLVQIICVEVRMLLEDKSIGDLPGDVFLLTACYRILESVITTMVSENWFQSNRDYASQMLNSLKMAVEAMLDFVKRLSVELSSLNFRACLVSEKFNSEQIVLATIRVLCAWLAEETFVLQEKVHEILPFIIQVCREWFVQTHSTEFYSELDPLHFLIPPLCHLTADDISRKILLANGVTELLLKFMEHNWCKFEQGHMTDVETHLTTVCSVFLNIVVFEPQVVAENDEFFTLLKLLMNALPVLSADMERLVMRANFSVLGLFITRQCHKKVKSCETSFYRFLSASIKFLWDAHHVEVENEIERFVVTRQYREVWGDVMELWFLGMEALSTLLPRMPWIAGFLAESGWPTVIVDALSSVSLSGIDENVKCSYQALLCPLVKISSEVAEAIEKHGAVAMCKKHKLLELEGLLLRRRNH